MKSVIEKLENPRRVQELHIDAVLEALGVAGSASFCDVGAGTGLFSLAAAQKTAGTVYALEISPELLRLLEQRRTAENLSNIRVCRVEGDLPLRDSCCDAGLLATVFHELAQPQAMLSELRRALKDGGKLGVIEFFPEGTGMGPAPELRVSPNALRKKAEDAGFRLLTLTPLSENLYLSVFEKPQA